MKKRIISALLSLALIFSVTAVLSGCGKMKATGLNVSKKTVEVNFSEYKLIKPSSFSVFMTEQVLSLVEGFRSAVGVSLRPTNDMSADAVKTTDLEILIGDVNRVETVDAKKAIVGDGYTISVFENKLVIVGTTNLFTAMGVRYFVENYLNAENISSGTLTLPRQIVLNNAQTISLVNAEGKIEYAVVYDGSLDDKVGNELSDKPSNLSINPDQVDLPVAAARSCAEKIVKVLGTIARSLPKKQDNANKTGPEVIVGLTNRENGKIALAQMKSNEYGVMVVNGDIVVTSWSDSGVSAAATYFDKILDDAVREQDGQKQVVIPADFKWIKKMDNKWISDFPQPTGEGIEFSGAMDVYDDSLLHYYTGDGANQAAYENYCAALTAAGYSLYSSNDREGNFYRTYNSPDKKHTLYVSYLAFAHAVSQGQNPSSYRQSIRVISAPMDSVNLIPETLLTAQEYKRITDPSITSVRLAYETGNFGMSYVVMLEDGSFIVFDGGGSGKSSPARDHDQLYAVLRDLYSRARGGDENNVILPKGDDPLVIAGWIMTHQHWDHYAVFKDFCKSYGKSPSLKIEALYANFISYAEFYNSNNYDETVVKGLKTIIADTDNNMKYYKLHSGMKFYLRNVEIEALYTHEDLYPKRLSYFNDSSTVVRLTIKNSQGGEPVTAVFLGDAYQKSSKIMRALYGTSIVSDFVQVSHHGYNAVEQELYMNLRPTVLLWPTSNNDFDLQMQRTAWYERIDQYIANNLNSVKYIVVQDTTNITITIGKNGPDYENLYSPVDHKKIRFVARSVSYGENYIVKAEN